MAVARVYGTVDGVDVVLELAQDGSWSVPVPLDQDGEYVVEIIAEDEAGNQSYLARMLYTVDAGNICIHMFPMAKYLARRQPDGYQFSQVFPVCKGVAL